MPLKSCVWYFGFHDDQVKYIVFTVFGCLEPTLCIYQQLHILDWCWSVVTQGHDNNLTGQVYLRSFFSVVKGFKKVATLDIMSIGCVGGQK